MQLSTVTCEVIGKDLPPLWSGGRHVQEWVYRNQGNEECFRVVRTRAAGMFGSMSRVSALCTVGGYLWNVEKRISLGSGGKVTVFFLNRRNVNDSELFHLQKTIREFDDDGMTRKKQEPPQEEYGLLALEFLESIPAEALLVMEEEVREFKDELEMHWKLPGGWSRAIHRRLPKNMQRRIEMLPLIWLRVMTKSMPRDILSCIASQIVTT